MCLLFKLGSAAVSFEIGGFLIHALLDRWLSLKSGFDLRLGGHGFPATEIRQILERGENRCGIFSGIAFLVSTDVSRVHCLKNFDETTANDGSQTTFPPPLQRERPSGGGDSILLSPLRRRVKYRLDKSALFKKTDYWALKS